MRGNVALVVAVAIGGAALIAIIATTLEGIRRDAVEKGAALEAARAEIAALKEAKDAAEKALAALAVEVKKNEAETNRNKETVEAATEPWYDLPLPSDVRDLLRSCAMPSPDCPPPPGGASGAVPPPGAETNRDKPGFGFVFD